VKDKLKLLAISNASRSRKRQSAPGSLVNIRWGLRMRTMIIRSVSILGILLVLFTTLVAVVRFYPYPYDFSSYPKLTHTQSGAAGDPINMLFVGSKEQITQSFHQAGWLIPDPITLQTSEKIAVDSLTHKSYPTAPVIISTPLGGSRIWPLKSPPTMSKTGAIFESGGLVRSSMGNPSG